MVLATPVAQRLNFSGSAGMAGFPGSLMGRLSYVKQVLSDAHHYDREVRLYRESPQGRRRPEYDRTLAPIRDAVSGGLPFLIPADLGREIDRALELAGEYGLRPILYGGRGAYERLERLRRSPVPVVVSLDWPEEERDRDPEAATPLATLYHRRMAPATPKLLAAAGIPFAFTSDGLPTPSKVFESVRRAIVAGLSDAAALEALTVGAARIFGVDDRLGSIEAGKIANLVLATAEPWAEDVEIKAVFVDGRKYQLWEPSEPTEPPASDVTGVWELTLHTPRGEREVTAEFEMAADGKVSGELVSERGTRTVEKGRMSGDLLSFKTTQTMRERTMVASYSLSVAGDKIEGTLSAGPMVMDLFGERTSREVAAKGEDAGDEPAVTLAELEAAMALYRGPVREYGLVAITNATVYTVTGETIENGTVLVEDGKIRAVGSDVKIPGKADVIDAGGGSLIPGILDAHSHIAIEGGVNEGALAVTSMVTIEDVVNPDDVAIYRALAGGVTTINALHGSANPIGGGSAVLKLRWGRDAAGLRFAGAPPNLKMALGENPKRARRFPGMAQRYPATRMGVIDVIRQAFSEASEYQKEWRDHERAVEAGGKPLPPRVDFKLERLVEVLTGERLVHAHCYRADEILQMLLLAEELGFRISALVHVLEGYKVADEIAAHGAGATTFSDWWGYKVEAYDAIPHNAALMTERGVLVSLKSDSAEEMRHLNQEAAKAMKWGGLDEIEALKLVTWNPARQLGIDHRVGSIEVGKDADLVLYDGHPLAIAAVVQKTFVDGDLYFDREADRARQAAIDAIREKLKPKDEDENGEPGEAGSQTESEPQTPAPEEEGR
ncbi:MAG: amidohydrolase family protein [bacterium]|nr:amidohydrolase family protein [bacterium]